MASSTELTATEAITRILYLAPLVHIYAIPPIQSNRGHIASQWTASTQNEIFTARIRIVETSDPTSTPSTTPNPISNPSNIRINILLEDRHSAELFAGAPYTSPSIVEATIDSSRFFVVRVVGEGGRKAVLGIGFEERGEALDFSIALQEARKVLGLEAVTPSVKSAMPSTPTMPRSAGLIGGSRNVGVVSDRSKPETAATEQEIQHVKRDWSLKEGQMLHVDLAGKNASVRTGVRIEPPSGDGVVASAGSAFTLLPPPPSAKEVREDQQRGVDGVQDEEKTLEELGFDDGEFGEFQ